MRYPKFLKKGGTIGFVAPSYGCNMDPYRTAFDSALETFRSMGFHVDLGPNCYEGSGIGISNTPQKCAAELQKYYSRRSNDVLISCGGGELMCEDLNYLDFDKLAKAKPKWYMGYSDNTHMTFLLATLCDTASIYGPCAATFGMEPWHPAIEDAFALLTGEKLTVYGYDAYETESEKDEENPLAPYNVTEPRVMVKVPDEDVHMEGRLIGGCLDVLTMYTGTKYDRVKEFTEKYKEDGIIWFLEACDLNPMGIRRALWQLEQAGWFRYVKGFLIGRPLCHGEEFLGMNQYDAVMGILEKYHVPVLMDLDIGHIPPAMPLICGSYAKVETQGNEIAVEMLLK
ncbi:MAG: LD-carboxypeptidase [Clostridiales bacterium]|nr:LD-carboxypeptidase [Clostridiales bacterium]